MGLSKIKSASRQPLSVVVYENIKSAIISGEIEAGTRLTETAVSEQMDVSSTPVREAFSRLASEGLIKIIPYRGAIVQEFTPQEILEVYQCREALEVMAIELAIDHIDEKGITELKKLLKKSKDAANYTKFVEINTEMHEVFFEYAKNDTLLKLVNQIQDVILNNRNVSSYNDVRKEEIYEEHKLIITALENKDKEQAKTAMADHIQNGYKYIMVQLAKEK